MYSTVLQTVKMSIQTDPMMTRGSSVHGFESRCFYRYQHCSATEDVSPIGRPQQVVISNLPIGATTENDRTLTTSGVLEMPFFFLTTVRDYYSYGRSVYP